MNDANTATASTVIANKVSGYSAQDYILDTTAVTPTLTVEDMYINASDAGTKVSVSTADMVAGDMIQLKKSSDNVGGVHTVTSDVVITVVGMAFDSDWGDVNAAATDGVIL